MTPIALLFLMTAAVAILTVPRRWAPVPLLAGACYMTLGQGIIIGGFHFYFIRLLLLVGLIRIFVRHERPHGGMLGMDWAFVLWAGWAILASAFHNNPADTLQMHLGMVYNGLSIYFLFRCFVQTEEDIRKVLRITVWLLVPVALTMVYEQTAHYNIFSVLGGINEVPIFREGHIRSQGPFAHPILAGIVGGVCIPLMIGLWGYHPFIACVGLTACLGMVLTSHSSGPLISLIFGLLALVLWHWRHWTRQLRWAALFGYMLLELLMKAPAYYLITRIPMGGKAWHRADIIDAGVNHINEWWFAGTDYTRHWMAYGVTWSPDHADITNHFLGQGVKGGLLLMLLFICFFWIGFRYVGQILQLWSHEPIKRQFLVWSLGASLFTHMISCISVAYFDQSILFLYLTLALTANIYARATGEVLSTETSTHEVSLHLKEERKPDTGGGER